MPTVSASLFEDEPSTKPTDRNLLALAKQNRLTVTGGYAKGGHNTGSKHYQGSADNPGAIDVDPGAVTPDKIQQWKSQGYTVRDERTHPQGQAKWTGPHYHLEVGSPAGNQATQRPKPQAMATQPKEIATAPISNAPMPIVTDANGNQVVNPAFQQAQAKASKPIKVVDKRVADMPTVPASNFEDDDVQSIADSFKDKPNPQVAQSQQQPQPPSLGEGLINVGKAGIKYLGDVANQVGQIPQALGAEYNQFQKDPNVELNAYAATGAGVAQGVRDLVQLPLSAPSILQNAYMGREVSKPLVELPNVKDVPVVGGYLQQAMQDHPVFSTTGNLVGQSLPLVEGLHALTGKRAPTPIPKELPAQKELPHYTGGTEGDLVRHIAENTRRTRPIETIGPGQLNPADMTANPKELTPAFKARGGVAPGQTKGNLDAQILGPDGRPVLFIQEGVNKTSYDHAVQRTREIGTPEPPPSILTAKGPAPARREIQLGTKPNTINTPDEVQALTESFAGRQPQNSAQSIIYPNRTPGEDIITPERAVPGGKIEINRGIPEGRSQANTINPITGEPYATSAPSAKESAEVLKKSMNDIDFAQKLRDSSSKNFQKLATKLLKQTKTDNLVDAQRAIGSRINELEAKVNDLTPIEGQELVDNHKTLQEFLHAGQQAKEAESLLTDTKKNSPREQFTGDYQPTQKELPQSKPEKSKVAPEFKTKLAKDEIPKILDSSGNPVNQKTEIIRPPEREVGERAEEPPAIESVSYIPGRNTKLRTSKEIGMRRAEALDQQPRELHGVDTTSTRILEGPGAGIQKPAPREIGPSILDANGSPIRRGAEAPVIERAGKPEARALELPESYQRPQPKEAGTISRAADSVPAEQVSKNVQPRPEGGHVYSQGRDPEAVDQMAQSLEKNNQILALEDAKKLLADKKANGLLSPEEFRKQSDILNLFHEAGRTGKTFQSARREIKEGEGRISKELGKAEVKSRDSLSPFAITVKARKPATEVSNLVKRLGSPEAARDQLRQLAGKYGITPTTTGKTVTANARKIAEQIASHPKGKHEFSDIYLNAHNFKTGGEKTLTDAPRGYPLRTFEGANIGTESASIPKGALNQNTIAKHFEALDAIRNSPDTTPEVKQAVTKVIDNPGASFKDIRKMRKLVSENLESFCKVWSLK